VPCCAVLCRAARAVLRTRPAASASSSTCACHSCTRPLRAVNGQPPDGQRSRVADRVGAAKAAEQREPGGDAHGTRAAAAECKRTSVQQFSCHEAKAPGLASLRSLTQPKDGVAKKHSGARAHRGSMRAGSAASTARSSACACAPGTYTRQLRRRTRTPIRPRSPPTRAMLRVRARVCMCDARGGCDTAPGALPRLTAQPGACARARPRPGPCIRALVHPCIRALVNVVGWLVNVVGWLVNVRISCCCCAGACLSLAVRSRGLSLACVSGRCRSSAPSGSSVRHHSTLVTPCGKERKKERPCKKRKKERKTYARCQACVKGALASKSHRGHALWDRHAAQKPEE
jgi:hypothetical protein